MNKETEQGGSWLATFSCTRAEAEALSRDIPAFAMIESPPVLVTSEVNESGEGQWRLDAYFDAKPDKAALDALRALLPSSADAAAPKAIYVPAEDWVTISQQGLEPVAVGRFNVHASTHAPISERGTRNFCIDAAQAFGTGHHETTYGCLETLDRLERSGKRFANIADIGTGTGLLAFAAQHLWPRAAIIASDIDPVAVRTAGQYARDNDIKLGRGRQRLTLVTANGTNHRLIARRAPYDLLIANILAGPLTELAPAFSAVVGEGGRLLLAGLLDRQSDAIVQAYRLQGFRLEKSTLHGEWPTLLFVKRHRYGTRRGLRGKGNTRQGAGDFGEL